MPAAPNDSGFSTAQGHRGTGCSKGSLCRQSGGPIYQMAVCHIFPSIIHFYVSVYFRNDFLIGKQEFAQHKLPYDASQIHFLAAFLILEKQIMLPGNA